jgi:hypothetical protein
MELIIMLGGGTEVHHLKEKESRDKFAKLVFVSNYQLATYNMALGLPKANWVHLISIWLINRYDQQIPPRADQQET